MSDTVISAHALSKHYGPLRAVDGVDLNVTRGELFGLIGHNGAGKSTLFKMMQGLIPASAGHVDVLGQRVGGATFREARRHIGYLPEQLALYDNLSGRETLAFFARLKGVDGAGIPALLQRVGLAYAAERRVRTYSKGMRQRLGFAQALLGSPRLLFLDEPTNGLDPEAIHDFYRVLEALRGDGVTMVLTSHILSEIQTRVERIAILRNGCVHACGSVDELRARADLPLTLQLATTRALTPPEQAALTRHGVHLHSPLPGRYQLAVPRAAKLAVLAETARLGGVLCDFNLIEPSLEDVFLRGDAA